MSGPRLGELSNNRWPGVVDKKGGKQMKKKKKRQSHAK
jgi:hypothetical protein